MRSFRNDRTNLLDARIAYLFLLGIGVICTVMGILASRSESRLDAYELEQCYHILSECADSLHAWERAETEEERLSAALRFRSAATALPPEAERETMLTLADRLRMGEWSDAAAVQRLADTFSVLGALTYEEPKAAWATIFAALEKVSDASLAPETAETEKQQETTSYSLKVAKRVLDSLFETRPPDCQVSADGSQWIAEIDNLRLVFSSFDGSLESFVYIRLGQHPTFRCSEAELVASALNFAEKKLGMQLDSGAMGESLGGFSVVELCGAAGEYRAVLDRSGRVWSLAKVKR